MGAELIGWFSSAVLLATLSRQVHTQWKSERAAGVSRWLFIGQLAASLGFAVYSWLLENWVFLVTNIALLITAILGEVIYLRNRRKERRKPAPPEEDTSIDHSMEQITARSEMVLYCPSGESRPMRDVIDGQT